MADESKLRFLDGRLERIQGLLKNIMDNEDYGGDDAVQIVENVDIQSIDALTGSNGERMEYIQFVDSEGDYKLQSQNPDGNKTHQTLFAPSQDEGRGATIRSSAGAAAVNSQTDKDWGNILERKIEYFSQGDGSIASSSINKEKIKTVRQHSAALGSVFGFNTPEDQEMFVAAWLSPDTTTRLSGIPGTGKTTLIECAGLLFGNSYGFISDRDDPNHQRWDSRRTESQQRDWDDDRFKEEAYRYPFSFILNFISGEVEDIVTETIKTDSIEFLKSQKHGGLGGCLNNDKFVIAESAFKKGYLLYADAKGEPDTKVGESVERNIKDGWLRWPPDDEVFLKEGEKQKTLFTHYKVIPIKEVLKIWTEGSNASDGTAVASAYKNAKYLNPFMVDLAENSTNTEENARTFIGNWYYDYRIDDLWGTNDNKENRRGRIDSEMRKEIGIAKVDKDKRAEQLLYGVDISSESIGDGGLDYRFKPFPRPIVTQPIKFFNEVNRSQAGVEDAILGLIAEGEVEYRGEVFRSPQYTAFMDTNPHVGGNDLAFTDRIDMELLFPSALLDQRYKILKTRLQPKSGKKKTEKPRRRILDRIIEGKITPLRYFNLKEIWKNTGYVKYEVPGYNALMDISIISTLFAQRYAVHEPDAEVTLEFKVPGIDKPVITHKRNSGDYKDSLIPLDSSGYFLDASLSESRVYRTNLQKSRQALARGHGAVALLERVLAMRFTLSLAKLSRSLAYLRGNEYVTRKEVMDCLPYVVGHRMGRARGDGGKIENGLNSDAATAFSSGQEFVRQAIIKGYIGRAVDSFGSTSMGQSASGDDVPETLRSQNRWVEWDSMLAQAREDLVSARTYPEYEMKMWAMARMASGDGDPAQEAVTGTGDPMPYLIYRLVLMEELAGNIEKQLVLGDKVGGPDVFITYTHRIEQYGNDISDILTTLDNYSANDVGILRRRVTLDRWLTVDSKRALLNQIDAILNTLIGFQIPDNFGPKNPNSHLNAKVWGLYSACPQQIPEDYRKIGLLETSKFIGFPENDFIRNHSWYGGSDTGRASKILYVGAEASLENDAYLKNKEPITGSDGVLATDYAGAIYPTASKRHLEQTASLAASVANDDQFSEVDATLSTFLDSIRDTFDAGNTQWVEMGAFGTSPIEHDWDTFYHELKKQIETVKDDNAATVQKDYVVELHNEPGTYSFSGNFSKTDWDDAATALINSPDGNRLRFYVSVRGNPAKNYVCLNFCLASMFVTLDSNGNLKPVAITSENPLGVNRLKRDERYGSLKETTSNAVVESFFDLGNITRMNVIRFRQCVEAHLVTGSTSIEMEG